MSFCNWLRTKKMAFENENAIAKEYFYHHIKENRSFAHLVFFLMKFVITSNLIKMISLIMKRSLVFFATIKKILISPLKAGKIPI